MAFLLPLLAPGITWIADEIGQYMAPSQAPIDSTDDTGYTEDDSSYYDDGSGYY